MITEMIAQVTSPSAAELGLWLGCLAAILFIMNQGMKFFRNFREMPPPAQTYATKLELDLLRKEVRDQLTTVSSDIDSMRCEMKEDKDAILSAGEHRSEKIHERINDVLEAVSELRGKFMGKNH